MPLQVGGRVWLPCEVKPGPFSNERLVRIELPESRRVGFVDTSALKEVIETGSTSVPARVIAITESDATAIVQGHAFDTRQVQASTAKVQPVVPLSP